MVNVEEREELPEHLQKFEELDKKKKDAINSTLHASKKAKLAGEDEIKDENGRLNYGLLEDTDNHDPTIDAIADVLYRASKHHFKVEDSWGDEEEFYDFMIEEYIGITRDTLKDYMTKHKSEFFDKWDKEVLPQLIKRLDSELSDATMSHLDNEHIDDLIRHSQAEDYIRSEFLRVSDAAKFYRQVKEEGVITKNAIETIPEEARTKKASEDYGVDYIELK